MIIYGSRMYGKANTVVSHGRCQNCGKYGRHESYDGKKWGHIYFIPLIPMSGKVRVLRECKQCNMGSHMPHDKVPAIIEGIRKNLSDAIIAISSGDEHVQINGTKVPALGVLANNLEDVYAFIGEQEVLQFLEHLREAQVGRELKFTEAKIAALRGQKETADLLFYDASENSENSIILFHYAQYLNDTGRAAAALPIAQKLELQFVDDMEVKQLLLNGYEATQQWQAVVDTYENCFLIVPQLQADKNVYKLYKKACKKAGRTPKSRKLA